MENKVIRLLLVEDNLRLQAALKSGLEATGAVRSWVRCAAARTALERCLAEVPPDVILMDVELAGADERHRGGRRHPARVSAPAGGVLLDPGRRRLLPRLPPLGHPEPLCLRAQVQLPAAADDRARCCAMPSPGAASSIPRSRRAFRRCATRTSTTRWRCSSPTSRSWRACWRRG